MAAATSSILCDVYQASWNCQVDLYSKNECYKELLVEIIPEEW